MVKFFVSIMLSFFAWTGHAGEYPYTAGTDRIGCGEMVSVRNVNQKPLVTNDSRYKPYTPDKNINGQGAISGIFQILGANPITAIVGEVATVVVAGHTRAPSSDEVAKEIANQEAANDYKDVVAIKFKFDDGREINIPTYRISIGYKSGERFSAFWSRPNKAIVFSLMRTNALQGDSRYDRFCSQNVDKETADAAIAASANLVDESKIIP
jgi:hypothetical protein